METEQMMARLLAEIRTGHEYMRGMMERQIGSLASRMEADREERRTEMKTNKKCWPGWKPG
jgi:hypothetical protein